ncbi:hypothetical protein BGZ94_004325 [Podila epigama]|nr:hypothetical protein BGZ94_004325 [Podila epigama]
MSPSVEKIFEPRISDGSKPRVIIAGAGLGGLTLGVLLKQANVPFVIFDSAPKVNQAGTMITIGGTLSFLFKQLRIADSLSISRPDLYNLLLHRIPSDSIHFGKKIASFEQNDEHVLVTCTDDSKYQGDILVGADGAQSKIREHLFQSLKNEGKLSDSDQLPQTFHSICLAGHTETLDPSEHPYLRLAESKNNIVRDERNLWTWTTSPTKANTSVWTAIRSLGDSPVKEEELLNSPEWGSGAIDSNRAELNDFMVLGGHSGRVTTLGDYIEKTSKNSVTKIALGDRVFDSWYHGRTVLLGDACHRIGPVGSFGYSATTHGAVTLANWIVTMQSSSQTEVDVVFKEYYEECHPAAKEALQASQWMTQVTGHSTASAIARQVLKRTPLWVSNALIARMSMTRYQVSFLPLIENTPQPQASLQKTLEILQKRSGATTATPL